MSNLYVDNIAGDPENDGSENSPFLTFNDAISVASNGDTVFIKCSDDPYDDYTHAGDIGDGGLIAGLDNLTIDKYGERWEGDLPIFHYVRNNGSTWFISNCNYLKIRNINFKGKDAYNASYLFSRIIRFGTLDSSYITLEYCVFDCQYNNTVIEVADNILVTGLTITNCYAEYEGDLSTIIADGGAVRFINCGSTAEHGILNLKLQHLILRNWQCGVHLINHGPGSCDTITIENNHFIDVGKGNAQPAIHIEKMLAGEFIVRNNHFVSLDENARGIDVRNYTAGTITIDYNSYNGYATDCAGGATLGNNTYSAGLGALLSSTDDDAAVSSSVISTGLLSQLVRRVTSSNDSYTDSGDANTGLALVAGQIAIRIVNNEEYILGATIEQGYKVVSTHLGFILPSVTIKIGDYLYDENDYEEYEVTYINFLPGGVKSHHKEIYMRRVNEERGWFYDITTESSGETSFSFSWITRAETQRYLKYGTDPTDEDSWTTITIDPSYYTSHTTTIGSLSLETRYYLRFYNRTRESTVQESEMYTFLTGGNGNDPEDAKLYFP